MPELSEQSSKTWRTSRMGGVWQWLMIIAGLSCLLAAFFIFAKGQSFRAELPGPTPGRHDLLMIPLISFLIGAYCLNQALRIRFQWNTEVIQDKSRYFVFREFRWGDLTDVTPTPDGVGRSLMFGTRGSIDLTQTGGSGTVPLRDIWIIEEMARKKLSENARTS